MDRDNKILAHKLWRGSLLPTQPSSALPRQEARARNHQLQATGVQRAGEAEQLTQLLQPLAKCPSPHGSRGFYHTQSQQQNLNVLAAACGFPTDILRRDNGE